jgi:Meckel syndrome type 1 protein
MSTTSTTPTPSDTPARTYRGGSLDELLPRIRAELGDDAVVLREREGLQGGVGGFFQKAFVEVEARAGAPRVDVYDDAGEAAADEREPAAPFVPLAPAPAEAPDPVDLPPAARGFGSLLAEAYGADGAPVVPDVIPPAVEREALNALTASETLAAVASVPPAPVGGRGGPMVGVVRERPPAAAALEASLVEHGLSAELAWAVVAETVTHELPFASARSLKRLVRGALARLVPAPAPRPCGRTVIALVGPRGAGRTHVAASLAAAYARAGEVPVICLALGAPDGGAELGRLLGDAGVPVHAVGTAEAAAVVAASPADAVVVLDAPAPAPRDDRAAAALMRDLRRIGVTERHAVLAATTAAPAAREVLGALAPLAPTALALTHADASDAIGGAIEAAIRARLPLSYVASATGVQPADPQVLAAVVLP